MTVNQIKPPPLVERNSQFEAVVAAIQGFTRSHPTHEPLYATPHDNEPYWLCRYGWGQYNITIHTRGAKVMVSVHHKTDFIAVANMEAVEQIEHYLRRTIPNTKFRIKQIEAAK